MMVQESGPAIGSRETGVQQTGAISVKIVVGASRVVIAVASNLSKVSHSDKILFHRISSRKKNQPFLNQIYVHMQGHY